MYECQQVILSTTKSWKDETVGVIRLGRVVRGDSSSEVKAVSVYRSFNHKELKG